MDLKSICRIFNRHEVQYMVVGAHACALLGHVRATEDYDFLIDKSPANLQNTIHALEEIFPDLPEKIQPADIMDNVVLKIIDEIEIDVTISAWVVTYEDALHDRRKAVIDGIEIPYMGIDSLIKSKSTQREVDQWDVRVLKELLKRRAD